MTLVARILVSLLACLWILASPDNLVAQVQDPADVGRSTVRATVTYADTGRPIRNASVKQIELTVSRPRK